MEQTIVGKEQNRKTSEDGRTENAAPIRKEAEQTAGAVRWTPEQRKVIDLRGRSMLVSAAAGSGKTAVLVERIISLVTDSSHPVDVDQLLVVTFTNAAAAEMRERVLNAIEKAVEADPGNVHLQRQMTLIHNAQITTIDSFCSYVLRGYFHKIGLEPGFRIGDPGELTLLREDVCDQVLEEFYAGKDPQFLLFTDSYSAAKSDRPIREMILRMYDFSPQLSLAPGVAGWMRRPVPGGFCGRAGRKALDEGVSLLPACMCRGGDQPLPGNLSLYAG